MKKFNKKSLLIAPMALILFGSSVNIHKVMADDNTSWSQNMRKEQDNKRIAEFKARYTNKDLENLASENEKLISERLNIISKYIDNEYIPNLSKEIKNLDNKINEVTNINNKDDLTKAINEINNLIINNHYNMSINGVSSLNNDVNDNLQIDIIKKDVDKNYSLIKEYLVNKRNDADNQNKLIKLAIPKAEDAANNYKDKANNIDDSHNLKNSVIRDLDNVRSDMYGFNVSFNITHDSDITSNLNEINNKMFNWDNYEDILNEIEENNIKNNTDSNDNKSVDLNSEIDNLKKQFSSINTNSSSNYISNGSSSKDNTLLNNEINNIKKEIEIIKHKDNDLNNMINLLKNETNSLKKQLNHFKHKDKNNNLIKTKKNELKKINRQLKKKIKKSKKNSLIKKRNALIKKIKQLNK